MTLTLLPPSCLEVEADAGEDASEAWVGAEGVEHGVEGEPDEGFGLGVAGAREPVEGLVNFAERGVDDGDVVGRDELARGEGVERVEHAARFRGASEHGVGVAGGGEHGGA